MSIASHLFYLCLVPTVAVFHLLPERLRPGYLLAASLAFYLAVAPSHFVLLLAATALAWLLSARLSRAGGRARRILLALGAALLVGTLALFKIEAALDASLAVPLGLSFYVLRLVGHLVEVHDDPAAHERDPVRFALWATFFPQIVSGPLQGAREFLAELDRPAFRRSDFARLEAGCERLLVGLFLKLVIADRLSALIAAVEESATKQPRWLLLVSSYALVPQVFADLAGYTAIALGLGQLFGIEGPENFDAPFAAADIQQFWRRWHMSLTGWLTRYVYTPLRMRMRGARRWGRAASLMATMILIGLWHRVSSGYLAFGAIHGALMIGSALTLDGRDRLFARIGGLALARRVAGAIATLTWVTAAQVFASRPTVGEGLARLRLVLHPAEATDGSLTPESLVPALACGAFALLHGAGLFSAFARGATTMPRWARLAALFSLVIVFSTDGDAPFVYAGF